MEPLQSFHLATAYAPLTKNSAFNPNLIPLAGAPDTLAFCHVLQHYIAYQNNNGAFRYQYDSVIFSQCFYPQEAVCAADSDKVTIQMLFDEEATRVEKLNLHIDLSSASVEAFLRSGNRVEFKRLSVFVVELNIGSGSLALSSRDSTAGCINHVRLQTRIARKSAYVEFVARAAAADVLSSCSDTLFPRSLDCGKAILENLGYISRERLPILDISDASKLK
ncbi:uncharacterized protein A1O5_05355 [Cladophialophora psammophila CBS 110553]|uniref:Uncharacterized protein n=1 Tax=Cladophialophora psammophila CBS 110553 TaxID=1182543 RepID=W9WTL2_9EURO|nr:uncharacterized protein A1O5_05355 [Cladophialophora psammophila CBS 110553]EXJ71547.1 hypothetical protein A1O5_05355 [Cladophialophora psammophila CBS 110553]